MEIPAVLSGKEIDPGKMNSIVRMIAAILVCLTVSAAAQTAPPASSNGAAPAQNPAPASSSAHAGWPTAQFAGVTDPSVQKAALILNAMIGALGGDAYLNIQDMTSEGRTYGFYHGNPNSGSLQFWRFWAWPDKERIELTKQRDITELYIGDKGYEITYKGTATQEPKDMDEYLRRRDHSLEWVVRKWLATPGTMILYSGTAMVEQNLADQVTVLNTTNDSVTLSVDPRSHLPVKETYSWRDPIDRQLDEEAIVFANYRLIQGIQTPFSTVRSRNGEMTNQRFITTATYNSGLSPTLFETKGITYNPQKQQPPK